MLSLGFNLHPTQLMASLIPCRNSSTLCKAPAVPLTNGKLNNILTILSCTSSGKAVLSQPSTSDPTVNIESGRFPGTSTETEVPAGNVTVSPEPPSQSPPPEPPASVRLNFLPWTYTARSSS